MSLFLPMFNSAIADEIGWNNFNINDNNILTLVDLYPFLKINYNLKENKQNILK